MLLAQKSYCEGALALELYCARLVDELHTGDDAAARTMRTLLLEVLTPIAKSWPSEWCLEANSLAIQVLGGYGYTRDFPVEQYWRDNRLNMIHEGTHGIQALDLLGRKVVMDGGAGLDARCARRSTRRSSAPAPCRRSPSMREALAGALPTQIAAATRAAWATGVPAEALANATPYLQAFGHSCSPGSGSTSRPARRASAGDAAQRGRLAACRYFFRYELPQHRRLARRRRRARRHLPRRWPRSGFEARPPRRLDTLIWVLIYGGLLAVGLGVALRAQRRALRRGRRRSPAAVLVAVGVVLIWVRSRMSATPTPERRPFPLLRRHAMSTPVRQLFDLDGKTALVTGGSRGLGLQIAEALGEAGARVLLTSRKADDLEESAAHLQGARHRRALDRRRR